LQPVIGFVADLKRRQVFGSATFAVALDAPEPDRLRSVPAGKVSRALNIALQHI
jgi:hypothetical protein